MWMELYRVKLAANNRRRKDLYSLSRDDQLLLTELGYKQKLIDIDQAILVNAQFIGNILQDPSIFANADLVGEDELEDRGEGERSTASQRMSISSFNRSNAVILFILS